MANWHDSERWMAMKAGVACPVCSNPGGGKPRSTVAELRVSYLSIKEDSPLRGYCCLVFYRHAVELHELSLSEAADLMADIQHVSAALDRVLQPAKINIEMHGNTMPHLHLHFYPRFPGDPYDGEAIQWRNAIKPVYAPDEFAPFVAAMREALANDGAKRIPKTKDTP